MANAFAKQTIPTVAQVADQIIMRLRQMGEPRRAQGARQYFKHQIVALGITTPALRLFMRERMNGLQKVWRLGEAIQLCDRLLQEPELEIRGAGFLALAAFKKALTPAWLTPAESWLKHRLDNWALVDGFCNAVLSPLLERHPAVERTLVRWSGAKLLWPRRAALVTLVPFARSGRCLELAYWLAQEHFGDPEDLMHKATGWLLREAGKTDPARLKRFLLQHGPAIPRTALRYAIERFPAAARAELLQATRKN
jgi:3-methyladenine DNA glycosylase AlkD